MNAKEFKKLLFEGPVRFSFKKKDGTIREALGTLSSKLTPSVEKTKTWLCENIQWDTDGEKVDLPLNVEIRDVDASLEGDELEEHLNEILEREYKFCIKNFDLSLKPPRKMPKSSILFYDLERGGFRSLREDGLLSYQKA